MVNIQDDVPAVHPAGTVEEPDPLRNDGAKGRIVVFQVAPDGIGKIQGGGGGQRRMGPPVQRCRNGPAQIVFQHPVQLLHDFADKFPGGFLGFFRYLILEHEQCGGQIQIRLQGFQQLRLQKQLL